MDDVLAALQGIEQPALAANCHGRVVAANASLAGIVSASGADLHADWLSCLGDAGRMAWEHGIGSRCLFRGSLDTALTCTAWTFRAAPLHRHDGDLWWLVTLVCRGDTDLDNQLVRLSLNAAVRAGHIGLWDWDPQTDMSIWSPELYDLYRLPRGDGVEPGSRFLSMLHPDDRIKVDRAVGESTARGGIDPFVFRLLAGDGSWRWIMTCAQVARTPAPALSRLVGINIDVTDTMHMEARLDEERAQRTRHEQITQAVMAHAPVGIAVALAGEGEPAYMSQFGADMMKVGLDEARTWSAWRLRHRTSSLLAVKDEIPLFRATRGEVIRDEEWVLEASDGRLTPISCNAAPIHDTYGRVIGGTIVWHDIASHKAAQRERELFLAAVSHELRTPLSAIQGWSAVLSRTREPQVLESGLNVILRNVATQARLVEDLLDVTRIAAGKLSMKLANEDMAQIVKSAVDSVAPMAAHAQVGIVVQAIGQPVLVTGDEQRLRQAICNLLTNAIKFSRPDGQIEVALGGRDELILLEITDHGTGIDADHLPQIFDPFWQRGGRAPNRTDGLGLGLTIARHIVEAHGGSISVQSAGLGQGTCFTLSLPTFGS